MATDYEKQATDFLTRNGLLFRATNRGDAKCPKWIGDEPEWKRESCPNCGHTHGNYYSVTIWRKGGPRLSFPFWGSLKDLQDHKDVTAYDVLACISSDAQAADDFDEFCGDYGYETDSRKALALFKRCNAFAKRMRKFFTESELGQLAEIH